jgi:formate hydrogenlyase subunit 4
MKNLSVALIAFGQVLVFSLCAPFISGVMRKIKNSLRMRRGPSVFQPYFNLRKLFLKDEVISIQASWIFYAAPLVVLAGNLCAFFLTLVSQPGLSGQLDLIVLLAAFLVLGIGRFFLSLAGLDTGSSFGGMGSSREMFISSLAEPALFTSVFAVSLRGSAGYCLSNLLAGLSILMVALAETSRIPIDNQETHLELTMVHEAMVLEYSGRSLALIELAGHIKQLIFFIVLSWCFFPLRISESLEWAHFVFKIVGIGLVVTLIEISVAKMRLFRVVDFLSFSFFMALCALVAAGLGL